MQVVEHSLAEGDEGREEEGLTSASGVLHINTHCRNHAKCASRGDDYTIQQDSPRLRGFITKTNYFKLFTASVEINIYDKQQTANPKTTPSKL